MKPNLAGALLESRKAQALLVGVVLAVFGPSFGLTVEQVGDTTNVILAYIVGQGVADAGTAIAKKTP